MTPLYPAKLCYNAKYKLTVMIPTHVVYDVFKTKGVFQSGAEDLVTAVICMSAYGACEMS